MPLPQSLKDEGKGRNQGRQRSRLPGNRAWEGGPHGGAAVSPGQALTVFQRSLTTMQIQVAGLLQFAVPLFPTAEVRRRPPRSICAGMGQGGSPSWTLTILLPSFPRNLTPPEPRGFAEPAYGECSPPRGSNPPPSFGSKGPCAHAHAAVGGVIHELFPTAHSLSLCLSACFLFLLQKDLLGIQLLLNSSESGLHQLTAMLDCRGLHKVLGWPWVAYRTRAPQPATFS